MARSEQDRDDILREATALVERLELRVPDQPDPIVAGFRRDGSASFFFGMEPVLQFNANGELRRGYDQGRLLKAEHGRLISLRRERDVLDVALLRHELTVEETAAFCARMLQLLAAVRDALRHGTARFGRRIPAESDVGSKHSEITWLSPTGQTSAGPIYTSGRRTTSASPHGDWKRAPTWL